MARTQINKTIATDKIEDLDRIALEDKKDIIHRIEIDFNKSRNNVLEYIRQYYPDVTDEQMRAWEESKALEKMTINGEDRYFTRAAQNLFRIDKEAKAKK